MLKKLLKHEFKATYRIFLPIYAALAIVTGLSRLALHFVNDYSPAVLQIATGFGVIILLFGFMFALLSPFIFLSMRFYRTTATREAYLTFTVPADTKIILFAKFIVTYIWTAVTTVISFLAILFFLSGASGVDLIREFFQELFASGTIADTLLYFGVLIVTLACSILSIFAAICLGQLVRDHRIIASFAFYAAIYTVQQIISVLALLPFMLSSFSSGQEMIMGESVTANAFEIAMNESYDMPVFLLSIGLSLVFSVVLYFLSNYMLKRKLNLL